MILFRTLILAVACLATYGLSAQENYKANAEGWLVDFEEAKRLSAKTGKPIMANFTGSDWCGWCKKLKREVFDKKEFKQWAADNVILLELDFPRRFKVPQKIAQQNYALQRAFKVRGYPSVWVFDLEEGEQNKAMINAYGKTGYVRGGPGEFIQKANQILANGK